MIRRMILAAVLMMLANGAAFAFCGIKTNFVLQPWAPGDMTQVAINNLDQAVVCNNFNLAGGPGEYTPSPHYVQNFGMPQFANCNTGNAATCQTAVDITAGAIGPSTTNHIGGLDVGTVQPNTDYCGWLVSKGTGSVADIGVVLSTNCAEGGPDWGLQQTYPHYSYLFWNRTNANCPGSGCAFQYAFIIMGSWQWFAGGTGGNLTGTQQLPVIAHGPAGPWTDVRIRIDGVQTNNFVGTSGDSYVVKVDGAGQYAAVCTSRSCGAEPLCDNAGNFNQKFECVVTTDRGYFAWQANSPNATLKLVAFHNGQIGAP